MLNDNEILLKDILGKIKKVISEYGEDKFYVSFSGGKDSTILSWLIDEALPDNNIPRVYADTGIELEMIRQFVLNKKTKDKRIEILKPVTPIKKMLEKEGYPFKSKMHSGILDKYQRNGKITGVLQYLGERPDKKPWSSQNSCPQKLKYQFSEDFKIRVSENCCKYLKKNPIKKYSKENKKLYAIVGIMKAEGGQRQNATCMVMKKDKLESFHPLVNATKEWEDWLIEKYNIEICDIYKEPYNFTRTGCKGCPFAKDLEKELDILEKYFPNERRQCENIWKPIYDEYRRLRYRLKKPYYEQIPLF